MASLVPRVRGAVERGLLESLASDPQADAHVRKVCDPEAVAAVQEAGVMTWLPYEQVLPLRAAHLQIRTREQVRAHYTKHFLAFTKAPVMQALSATLESIFGISGEQVHRVYPRIWSAFSKDCGKIEGEQVGPGHSKIRFIDPPHTLEHYSELLLMHEAALAAMFDYADMPAAIDVIGTGEAAYVDVRWAHEG